MNKAVFLDRDGVINRMIFNNERKEYEPPFKKEDLELYDGIIESLKKLQNNGFILFVISNQPDYAKGKASLESLAEVQDELQKIFIKNGIRFSEYYYCYHHPDGTVPEYSVKCECRKPGNYFVKKAITGYDINKDDSWLIGDRDKDVECGIKPV
ncbi:MAG: HAD-IIIA family hydrolase [Ignavibacteria bacterium]|nr:HAD-IIIA family hydrolase [Ignavibacteria bacterium]